MSIKDRFLPYLKGFFVGIIVSVCFLAISALLAWTSPTSNPPEGNVSGPINISAVGQIKQGGLMINTAGADVGLIVASGKVGIGTENPTATLDVDGDITAEGIIIADGDIEAGGMNTLIDKEFLENRLANLTIGAYKQASTFFLSGDNRECPVDSVIVSKEWIPRNCWGLNECTTPTKWSMFPPSCGYRTYPSGVGGTCFANSWEKILCANKVKDYLYGVAHIEDDCIDEGGVLVKENGEVASEGEADFCKFDLRSCPAGWTNYMDWCATEITTYCEDVNDQGTCYAWTPDTCAGSPVSKGPGYSHSWSNDPPLKCYRAYYFPLVWVENVRTQIGCY